MIYGDPYTMGGGGDALAYEQGKRDECCKIICWIALALFILGIIIWIITWATRPRYYVSPPIYRHNLVDFKHQAAAAAVDLLSN